MEYEIYLTATIIRDCYKVKDEEIRNLIKEIRNERIKKGYIITRSIESYIYELKTHKRLYKYGIFRNRTKDCDLEENINCLIELIYRILGR